ncbi:uroporphyrinogen-III C-methyltransferase [Phycicoccus sp. MAQZ13P-2]|uniref:uroporphyrinogen-III C-methyltransferase n=1 Tax=Phycicoccus mangrovi TaxID=2840470 RepID=UPI001C0007A7|nr:uroporphyrinogen-III C-methyltransferase [Phycicoccus mangrovi]MBT9255688.1 uroporphyrinogen-III C-methyltransferase [Phycicoccus mangrovi]MBT9274282.1 uroporphyrinogen-III C-methyltransferase [Phycicoccus mangrovi]
MSTLVGLDLAGRRVVVVGAGAVGGRRVRTLVEDGARVVVVDPAPSEDVRRMASHGDVELRQRPVVEQDVDEAWFVVAATGDPATNRDVAAWCEARRTWCVDASDGAAGSARVAAQSTHDDLRIGVVSTGAPDPRRTVAVRDALGAHVESGRVDLRRHRSGTGRVVLVGSGPGAPGLVTTAGREALATADVVVTDRLGATWLLDHLPDDVEVVNVGKSPTNHPVPQAEINRLLVEHALAGRTVVRFKGGDPYVFGRGGEEVHACRAAGVEVDVVPGITSAFSVPALAGIPVTQRGVATSVLVTSGHAGADPAMTGALAAGATVVLLMAVSALPGICDAALAQGVPADLPVAAVEQGSTAHERVTRATLATAARVFAEAGVRPPAVVVLGRVAAEGFLDDPVCATPPGSASDDG